MEKDDKTIPVSKNLLRDLLIISKQMATHVQLRKPTTPETIVRYAVTELERNEQFLIEKLDFIDLEKYGQGHQLYHKLVFEFKAEFFTYLKNHSNAIDIRSGLGKIHLYEYFYSVLLDFFLAELSYYEKDLDKRKHDVHKDIKDLSREDHKTKKDIRRFRKAS